MSQELVRFGRLLRARGLPVGTGRILTFCRAVSVLAPPTMNELYWAGVTTLISRPEDFGVFDKAFDDYFANRDLNKVLDKLFEFLEKVQVPDKEIEVLEDQRESFEVSEEGDGEEIAAVIASSAEVLRSKSFDQLSDEERTEVFRALQQMRVELPVRAARRKHRAHAGDIDLRRTLRKSLRTQGEPFDRAWRVRHHAPRPLVLILDVSGSMSAYSRALLQFGYAAMGAGRRVEVFCFGTRLTRVTRALRARDPDRALSEASALPLDWAGGTRIGESLKELIDRHGSTAALRGAVAVLCSDGLERGDAELLARQMARLRRLVHKIVWVNPLAGDVRYQPLARGMAAAMPHVDVFLPGHNLASIRALAGAVAG
jgi:uncharacterized protein